MPGGVGYVRGRSTKTDPTVALKRRDWPATSVFVWPDGLSTDSLLGQRKAAVAWRGSMSF